MSAVRGIFVTAFVCGALVLSACGNAAEEYVPKPEVLCCHSNWEVDILFLDDNGHEDTDCSEHRREVMGNPEHCYIRAYDNHLIRFGEAEQLEVTVGVHKTNAEAIAWLTNYTLDKTEFGSSFSIADESHEVLGDEGAKSWDFESLTSSFQGREVAFRRENLAIKASVSEGSKAQQETMLESLDKAIIDLIFGYESRQ